MGRKRTPVCAFWLSNALWSKKTHAPSRMNGCETVKVNRTGLTLFYFQYSIEKQSYKKELYCITTRKKSRGVPLGIKYTQTCYLDGPVSHPVIKHLENKQLFSSVVNQRAQSSSGNAEVDKNDMAFGSLGTLGWLKSNFEMDEKGGMMLGVWVLKLWGQRL